MQHLAIQIAHDSMSEVLHNKKQYNRYPKRYREVKNFVNRHALLPTHTQHTQATYWAKLRHPYYGMRLYHIHFC